MSLGTPDGVRTDRVSNICFGWVALWFFAVVVGPTVPLVSFGDRSNTLEYSSTAVPFLKGVSNMFIRFIDIVRVPRYDTIVDSNY